MFNTLREEMKTVMERDPAATGPIEVMLCYPGFHALVLHHLSHGLHRRRVPLVPRVISEFGRWLTGIEIHPGAKIGKNLFIDHGMGVVIGETAEIGDDVLMYQGVTLGGTGKEKGKRHPTIGHGVVLGAGAKVLGAIEVGDHVKIGAGSVVVKNVPPHTTVVGVPGRVVWQDGRRVDELDLLQHGELPDPEAEAIKCLIRRFGELEAKVNMAISPPAGGEDDRGGVSREAASHPAAGQAPSELKLVATMGESVRTAPAEDSAKRAERVWEDFIMGAGI